MIQGWTLLSSCLTVFNYPPFSLWWLSFFSLAPFFYQLQKLSNFRKIFKLATIWSFTNAFIVYFWVEHAVIQFSGLPELFSRPVAVLIHVFISFWDTLPFGIGLGFVFSLRKTSFIKKAFLFVLLYPLLDFFWPKAFPNTLGNWWIGSKTLSQFADVIGVYGLTYFILISNFAIVEFYQNIIQKKKSKNFFLPLTFTSLFFILALCSYGQWRLKILEEISGEKKLQIGFVQPNFNTDANLKAEHGSSVVRHQILNELIRLTKKTAQESALKPQIYVWPESAYPDTYWSGNPREEPSLRLKMNQFLAELNAPLVTGARDQKGYQRFNALYVLGQNKSGHQTRFVYHKYRLLKFAEYVPFSQNSPWLTQFIRSRGGTAFAKGDGAKIFSWSFLSQNLNVGPMICVEGLFPEVAFELKRAGAQMFFNVTNDSWFGDWIEPFLHLEFTRFRSIETRIPMVRSTNSGISALIDFTGKITFQTPRNEVFSGSEELIYHENPPPTIFAYWGMIPIYFLGLVGFMLSLGLRIKNRSR